MNKYTYSNYGIQNYKLEVDKMIDEIVSYLDSAAKKCADLSNYENQLSKHKDNILEAKEKILNYKNQGYSSSSFLEPFNKLKSIENSYKN